MMNCGSIHPQTDARILRLLGIYVSRQSRLLVQRCGRHSPESISRNKAFFIAPAIPKNPKYLVEIRFVSMAQSAPAGSISWIFGTCTEY